MAAYQLRSTTTMWDSFDELEEQEAHARAFGGNVGAPAINLDPAGNLIPPWGNSEPPVAADRSIGSMLADDEVAELRDADAAMSQLYDLKTRVMNISPLLNLPLSCLLSRLAGIY